MKIPLAILSLAAALTGTPVLLAQGDDADKKIVKRIVADMDLVPSLYARGEPEINVKTLPKFSATKLFGYPIDKKETAEKERAFWKASKEVYSKSHPLRAAIFEAMDANEKTRSLPLSLTLAAPLNPKDKAAFLLKGGDSAVAIFQLENALEQMRKAAEKRDSESSNRWKTNFDFAQARVLGNLIFMYEYNQALRQIRADALPELGNDDDGWRIVFKPRVNVNEAKAKTYVKDRVKLLQKMREEHAGTPWAYFAERDSKRELGMEWAPKTK